MKLNFPVRGFDVMVKSTEGERVMCHSPEGLFRQGERFLSFHEYLKQSFKCLKHTGSCLVSCLSYSIGGKKGKNLFLHMGLGHSTGWYMVSQAGFTSGVSLALFRFAGTYCFHYYPGINAGRSYTLVRAPDQHSHRNFKMYMPKHVITKNICKQNQHVNLIFNQD